MIPKPAITTTVLRCQKCGNTKIWKRFTTQRRMFGFTLEWCPHCRGLRFYRIEKTE